MSTEIHDFYEDIDGVRIHYEKVGNGEQVILLIPGAIGEFNLKLV